MADAPIVADPKFSPVMVGCWAGAVAPCAIDTVALDTLTLEGSLLVSVRVSAEGAGVDNVTGNGTVWPSPKPGAAGSVMVPRIWTVTLAVASGMFGKLLAWIVAEPAAIPVTATEVVRAPAENEAVVGTVATEVLLELRFTVSPDAGAGADKVSVRFCVAAPEMTRLGGVKLTLALICTEVVADAYPGADEVMVALPILAPVICGCAAGVV